MLDPRWNPSARELRQFTGIWLPLFVAGLGAIVMYRSGSLQAAGIIWGAGLAVSLIGLMSPAAGRLFYVGLMAVTFPIGWVVSHVVLAATYYLLFLPIGLALRLTGRDPLDRTEKKHSHWERSEERRDPGAYFRQF